MKRKIANGVQLVFLVISFIMLLIPCNTVTDIYSESVITSVVSTYELTSYFVLSHIPMCVLYALCAVMCIISIFAKEDHRDGKIHSILPVLLFITANWAIITCGAADHAKIVSTDFPGMVYEVCLLAVMILGVAKRSTLIAGEKNVAVTEVKMEVSSADELGKYKELLDKGVITQEEFDAKKKQLLNL